MRRFNSRSIAASSGKNVTFGAGLSDVDDGHEKDDGTSNSEARVNEDDFGGGDCDCAGLVGVAVVTVTAAEAGPALTDALNTDCEI